MTFSLDEESLIFPPQKLLDSNPKFSSLFQKITNHYEADISYLKAKCLEAKKSCDESRLKYLKTQTLHSEIQKQLLNIEAHTEQVFSNEFSQLFSIAPVALSTLSTPSEVEEKSFRTSDRTLFGLDKSKLLDTPNFGIDDIILRVEVSLEARLIELEKYYNNDDSGSLPLLLRNQSNNRFNDSFEEIQTRQKEIFFLQKSYFENISKLLSALKVNISLALEIILDVQTSTMHPYMHYQAEYFTTFASSLHLKLQAMKLQVLIDTYPPERVQSMALLRQELESHSASIDESINSLESQLKDYQAGGREFMKVAQAYNWILKQIKTLSLDIERMKL